MPKGYWVVLAEIINIESYNEYVAANGPEHGKYGGRFLARGGQVKPKEGQPKSRVVVVELPPYRAALDCYHSPEYSAAMKLRAGRSLWDMVITEGYEGPQPISV